MGISERGKCVREREKERTRTTVIKGVTYTFEEHVQEIRKSKRKTNLGVAEEQENVWVTLPIESDTTNGRR